MSAPPAPLHAFVSAALSRPVHPAVSAFAGQLATEARALGVLFYGSNLRTGSLDGVLDFYLLLPGPQREAVWPRIGYREHPHEGGALRAKTATLSLRCFGKAAAGDMLDTTIWTRFAQPAALAWWREEADRDAVVQAVAQAARTAAGLAAVLGPVQGSAEDYWRALFRATYEAEFRVEPPGRENALVAADRAHFAELLPLAWEAAGLPFGVERDAHGTRYSPLPTSTERHRWRRWWRVRRRLGKPLNILRLVKAAGTFDGAADYAAWKVHRHTGIALEATRFRRRHPILAVPGAAWELWRKRRGGAQPM